MPIHEAEALVLRHYSFAEADRIVVLLTREFGKLRGVAQGVKKPKSALGAALEPLNHIRIQFYMREGAELSRIRHCELIHPYLSRNPTLEQVYLFGYMAELAQEFSDEHHANDPFFRLMIAALKAGEKAGASAALARYVELWALKLSGLLPDYTSCANCGRELAGSGFHAWIEAGEGRCPDCSASSGIRVPAPAAAVLQSALSVGPEQFAGNVLGENEGAALERLTERLLQYHLEKRLKSYPAMKELLKGVGS
jgi:DNA repair protein RecO (recombination protein O)